MLATFDLAAVRHFADDLNVRLAGCNGEGMFCSDLDETIKCHVELCADLQANTHHWARAVFAGQVVFNPAVEAVFKDEWQRVLDNAKSVANQGRKMDDVCYKLAWLPILVYFVAEFTTKLEKWLSPRLSVGPAARVTVSDAADAQIRERIAELEPLPKDWRPKDPDQVALFEQSPAK